MAREKRNRILPEGRFATRKFLHLTRGSVARMREAQALRIIKPNVTAKGWRDFSPEDVTAYKKWKRAGFPLG